MKSNLTKLLTLKTTLLLTSVLHYSSCSPEKKSNLTSESNSTMTTDSQKQSHIVGGELADSNLQKSNGIVQLKILTTDGSISTCTGSLIEKDIVLTAAHCIAEPNLQAVAVLFALDDQTLTQDQVIYAVNGVVHEEYNPNQDVHNLWNDLALLKLEKEAPVDFKLAKLPTLEQNLNLNSGSKVLLAGYGITNAVLRKKVLDTKGRLKIRELASTGSGTLRKVDNIVVSEVRTDKKEIKLNQKDLRGACHGDSGGPAFLKQDDGALVLVGVTSRGTEELGNCNESAIYTGVQGHLDWINSKVSALHQPTATTAVAKN